MNDRANGKPCTRCGNCCAAFELGTITEAEADRIGREFCYRSESRWFIRRVARPWSPWWAVDGVCVFYYPAIGCTIYAERPSVCSSYRCSKPISGSKLDAAYLSLAHRATGGAMVPEYEIARARERMRLVEARFDAKQYRRQRPDYRLSVDGHYCSHKDRLSEFGVDHYLKRWRESAA